jgi:hypothetical protein
MISVEPDVPPSAYEFDPKRVTPAQLGTLNRTSRVKSSIELIKRIFAGISFFDPRTGVIVPATLVGVNAQQSSSGSPLRYEIPNQSPWKLRDQAYSGGTSVYSNSLQLLFGDQLAFI